MLSVIYYWSYWGFRAAFALIAAIPLSMYIFSRERPVTRAAVLCLVGGSMFLPEQACFDFPLLPGLDKYSIAALCVLLGAFMKAPGRVRAARLFRHPLDIILALMALGGVGTYYTNQDSLIYGGWIIVKLPGLTWYDGASIALGDLMQVGLPFFLGRIFLRTSRDVRIFFVVLASAGVIYSLPILYEIRMSPMLHSNVYGFMARRDWLQNVRDGSYRPTVFMGHGLVVGFFMCLSLISVISLRQAGKRSLLNVRIDWVSWYIGFILFMCKASGAFLMALASVPILLKGSTKLQMRVATFLAVMVFLYPALRIFDVVPTDTMVSLSRQFGSNDRAESLQFRFDNEDVLVLKGTERPWFGWGGYSREHVFDSATAKDLTVQDGHWIIVYGEHGIVGFLTFYGLMLFPIFMTALRMGKIPNPADRTLLAGFAFIIGLCAVNTLPNMLLPTMPFFLSGGLVALLAELPRESAVSQARIISSSGNVSGTPSGAPPARSARTA